MGNNVLVRTEGLEAQRSVIGSMLIDDRCIGAVMTLMCPDDFTDPTCRNTFNAIRKLKLEGKPIDPTTVVDAVSGGPEYINWARAVMEDTPTAANVEEYAEIAKERAAEYYLDGLAMRLLDSRGRDEKANIVRQMFSLLSATSRMPRMTAAEASKDFLARMSSKEKPEYLPWGIPTANCKVYAELGDMILLGGYSSSGKTLLSILMALAQAKRYRVGYYTLETQPEKMADRIFSHLSGVPMDSIKTRSFGDREWEVMAHAANDFATICPFDIIQAAGSSVDDIASDAVGHGYQIIYVDYLQLIEAPGVRADNTYVAVSTVSRKLKLFAQRTKTAVVALAQLSRPQKKTVNQDTEQDTKQIVKFVPPSMHSFRDSGQIEQDADAAFLLWPSNQNDNNSPRVLKLGKNKEGEKFTVKLAFYGSTMTMVELEKAPDRSVAAELSAKGRAVKRANRMEANGGQIGFRELPTEEDDNPFT